MKITRLHLTRDAQFVTAEATVAFEDNDRPATVVFFKTPLEHASGFFANPDAFLVGALLPALHLGERRISIDTPICPFLKEGLTVAMHILAHWTGGQYRPIAIETATRLQSEARTNRKTGLVISGGMDSLAALRRNHLNYCATHPAYVTECFFLHGFDIGGVIARGLKYHVYDRALNSLLQITQDAGVTLIPVYTNMRHLCDERNFWLNSFFGAVLAAMGHTFARRINLLYIASSYSIPHLHPCGSHPLLDPEYSSHELRMRHRDYELERLEKIRIVSTWKVAFQNFRVCLANVPERLNCGKCEKCVRTMTELIALGLLHQTTAFGQDDLRPEDLARFDITIRERPPFYRPLIPLLRQKGRDDLADTITALLGNTRVQVSGCR